MPNETYSNDEYFIDMMRYDILGDSDANLFEPLNDSDDALKRTGDLIELLEEYAPKLFNTIAIPRQSLIEHMFTLAKLVDDYRQHLIKYRVVKRISEVNIDDRPPVVLSANKYNGDINKTLPKSINIAKSLYENLFILGHTSKNIHLRKILKDFIDNNKEYITKPSNKRGEHLTTKNDIRTFLFDLKLKGKTDVINDFIEKIPN